MAKTAGSFSTTKEERHERKREDAGDDSPEPRDN